MKRYIKSSEQNDVQTFYIYVDVYIYNPYCVISASESDIYDPVTNDDGTVNVKALKDWELFVRRIALRFKHLFKIVDIVNSPPESSLTSRYFWVYAKNDDGTINIKTLIRLRLSDHYQSEVHKYDDEHNYLDNAGQNYKHPEKIKRQLVDLAEITVISSKSADVADDKTADVDVYETYSEAVRGVYAKASKIRDDFLMEGGESVEDWSEDVQYQSSEYEQKDFDAFTKNYRKAKHLDDD